MNKTKYTPVIKTCNGPICGLFEETFDGIKYCAFKGIPYAAPPIGKLRFKDPVPVKNWYEVRDSTKYGPVCLQYDIITQQYGDSEDCLHLNVYVNSIKKPNARKAVMVWIHGGGFISGHASDLLYGPDHLIKKDVVLVTVNYRLGILGFLNLEHPVASGNQGLKDQVMALKWVKYNIAKFGGDPNNVTIFGESAGGASVHYLTISPLSKGLFHKAISQSGVLFNCWASVKNPKLIAHNFCKVLGKELEDPESIIDFLQSIDKKELLKAQMQLQKKMNLFGPGVDDNSENPFMPSSAVKLAQNAVHVPYLVGYNSDEAIFYLLEKFFSGINKEDFYKNMIKYLKIFIEKLYKDKLISEEELSYYNSADLISNNCLIFIKLMSKLHFIDGIHEFLKIQAEKGSKPTYFYKFSYDTKKYSIIHKNTLINTYGVSHFDELLYLFKMRLSDKLGLENLEQNLKYYRVINQMTELWTNFAKYSEPTRDVSELIPVHWKPISSDEEFCYLNIADELTMESCRP